MKIRLFTLSPLHIGTGDELASLDYVALGDTFYRLTQDQFLEFIKGIPDGARRFADWIDDQYTAMQDIRDNRQLSEMEGRLNTYYFCQSIGQEGAFIQYLKDQQHDIFQAPVIIDERTRQRNRGSKVIPLGRVRQAVKNGRQRPVVPGSSVKGALRTAVFYHYLTQHADASRVERIVREQLNDRRLRKERFGLPLVHEAFYCGTKDTHSGKVKTDDEKMDLFKLVRVTDGHVRGDKMPLSLAKVNLYLVEKKQGRDRRESFFTASQQPQASYCETIDPGTLIEVEVDFDIDFLLRLKALLKDGAVPAGHDLHWINVEEKVRQLFGLDLQTLTDTNKEEKRKEVLMHLLACARRFSRQQLSGHRRWLDHFRKNDGRDFYTSRIEQGFALVWNREDQTLVHLGYATGFDGMTALLYFLADDRRKTLFKQVMERFNLGNKPGNRGRYIPNPDRFPKSKRLVETPDAIQPMGWLEILAEGEEPPVIGKAETAVSRAKEPVAEPEPAGPATPEYYDREINFKKPPELDAVVIRPGKPNHVQVYVSPDYMPEMPLMNYRQPLGEGEVIIVGTVFSKKGELTQVSFRKRKYLL